MSEQPPRPPQHTAPNALQEAVAEVAYEARVRRALLRVEETEHLLDRALRYGTASDVARHQDAASVACAECLALLEK